LKSYNIGRSFEAILAKSWIASGLKLVRMKITETGEEKPCDERIDFENYRVFNELKSTTKEYFDIKNIKKHQLKSLFEWDGKFKNSVSLVTIEFKNYDEAYIIDIKQLLEMCREANKITRLMLEKAYHYKLKKRGDVYRIDQTFILYLEGIKWDTSLTGA